MITCRKIRVSYIFRQFFVCTFLPIYDKTAYYVYLQYLQCYSNCFTLLKQLHVCQYALLGKVIECYWNGLMSFWTKYWVTDWMDGWMIWLIWLLEHIWFKKCEVFSIANSSRLIKGSTRLEMSWKFAFCSMTTSSGKKKLFKCGHSVLLFQDYW